MVYGSWSTVWNVGDSYNVYFSELCRSCKSKNETSFSKEMLCKVENILVDGYHLENIFLLKTCDICSKPLLSSTRFDIKSVENIFPQDLKPICERDFDNKKLMDNVHSNRNRIFSYWYNVFYLKDETCFWRVCQKCHDHLQTIFFVPSIAQSSVKMRIPLGKMEPIGNFLTSLNCEFCSKQLAAPKKYSPDKFCN